MASGFRFGHRLLLAALAALVAAAGVGCGSERNLSESEAATVVTVHEKDFAITASTQTVAAGVVDLRDLNRGPDAHELIVIRAPADADALPVRTDGMTVNEEALEHSTAGVLEPGAAGSVRDLRVRLKPGRYILLCNMAGHYKGGMHTVLVVR